MFQFPHAASNTSLYRSYTLVKRPAVANTFRLAGMTIGGRVAIYFSADDLSEGLVGQNVDGIIGYKPEIATAIVRNIILDAAK